MAKRWTAKQLEYLADNAGTMNHKELSKNLGRSINAIKLAQHRNGIHFRDNVYTYTCLSAELGRSRTILRKWYRRGWLVGRPATWTTYYGKRPMLFLENDIVKFLKKHYMLFKPRSMPNRYFANIVATCQGVVI